MFAARHDDVVYVREPSFLYCAARPVGAAAHIVARGWSIRAARCRTAVERAVPDTHTELYFNLGPFGRHLVGPDEAGASVVPRAAWVVGPHADSVFLVKEAVDCDVVVVRVLPGMIASVLGVSAAELSGRLCDLELFWGRSAVDEILERLFHERDALARVRLVEGAVVRRARASTHDCTEIRRLCSALERVPNPSVGAIARRFGLSHRRIISLFDEHIGLKPKEYQRIQRLRRVLERVSAGTVHSWAQLACETGYCDQAHLVNEFQRLAGITPTTYMEARSSVGEGTVPHMLVNGTAARVRGAASCPDLA